MNSTFRFQHTDNIGSMDAVEDQQFLDACFVDTGALHTLLDCGSPKRIVVGRTGSGKSALLHAIRSRAHNVISIEPESLSLAYLANSTILNFVEKLGIRTGIFFKLLWKHALVVELLKARYKIVDSKSKQGFLEIVKGLFLPNKNLKKAERYLDQWGERFWETTEVRVKELAATIESSIRSSLGADYLGFASKIASDDKESQAVKLELKQRAQNVVNEVQVQELSAMLDLLDAALDNRQNPYYIIIDRLDEDWSEDGLRLRVVKALIETVREFQKVHNAKVIIAIREDLLDRVISATRDPGFQEEKLTSLYLPMIWTKSQLADLVDRRLRHLVKQRYTSKPMGLAELFPTNVKQGDRKMTISDYIAERSLARPRDAIAFANETLLIAANRDKGDINATTLRNAEGQHSIARLRSLQDEWQASFPLLSETAKLLNKRPASFSVTAITEESLVALLCNTDTGEYSDHLSTQLRRYVDSTRPDFTATRATLVSCWYQVGLVGLKLESYSAPVWSCTSRRHVTSAEITDQVRVLIHPCFWRAFGVADTHTSYDG